MQTTFGARLDRYARQRDEWIHSLQMLVTPAIEQVMRKLYRAAEICAHMQPAVMTIENAYAKLVAKARTWTDDEMRLEIGEKKAEDADVCLQMAVKSHATVLALATARRCRQVISVPAIVKFFRTVLEAVAAELAQSDLFITADIDTRSKVRRWIDQIVSSQALAIVPVGLFAKCSTDPGVLTKAIRKAEEIAESEMGEDDPAPEPETMMVDERTAAETVEVPEMEPDDADEPKKVESETESEPEPEPEPKPEDETISVTIPKGGSKKPVVESEDEEDV